MTKEITYAFLDDNDRVLDVAIVLENDNDTLEILKQEKQATSARIIANPAIELYEISQMYWDGNKWMYDQPYASWIWSDENHCWEAPVAPPQTPPADGCVYIWNEEVIGWVEVPA